VIEFADLYRRHPIRRPDGPLARYSGAHQSDILAYIARKIGKLKEGEPLEEDIPERMLMGIMFEEFYFSMLVGGVEGVEWQSGEVVEDGIAVNCDGIGVFVDSYDSNPFIEETKCTEKKIKSGEDFLQDFLWMHQGRAYCYAYGPRVVRWTIWYYRGNWAGSGPVCMQYVVKFNDKEVAQTWAMLKKNKDAAMREIAERAAEKEAGKEILTK
jgi:hypothetical protein